MSDRYNRYAPRPRSPTYNPARASLPLTTSGYHEQPQHLHVVPSGRREVIPNRSSSSASNGTVMTTYKVTSDGIPSRGSSVREGSRSRRYTVDNHNRPSVIITEPSRHNRPIIHSGGGLRPASPVSNPFRSSAEEFVAIPASSRHGHHHRNRHSVTMDNGDIRGGGLRIAPVREPHYANIRSRPIYPVVRHADNVAEDYGDNEYGYTNPQEVVRYDLQRTAPPPVTRPRRDSYDGRTGRPTSISGYGDLVPRSYDARERGPPPSTRGFDRIPAGRGQWEPPQIRMPIPPPPSSLSPMDPIPRPAPFDPVEPVRRNSSRTSSRARPTSMYHDHESRRGPREDYYEVRDDERDRRDRHHHDRYEDGVEQRGYGIRAERERAERSERHDRTDRSERSEKFERSERRERGSDEDRSDYTDRKEHKEHKDHKDHKGRDLAATGASLAAAALGIKAAKNASRDKDDRDDREERRSDYDEEPRRRRDKDDRETVDLNGRDPKERRHRDDDLPPRVSPPLRDGTAPRDIPSGPPPTDKDAKVGSPAKSDFLDLKGRDPRERKSSKDDDPERRERRRRRSEASEGGSADSHSDSSVSPDDTTRPVRSNSRLKRSSGVGAAAFNPKDTMGLMALKEALNNKDSAPKAASKDGARTPRESLTKDPREASEIRKELDERRPRDPLQPNENRQLRVVSPPREKAEEKPVKSILRPPREKFPEDPAPIREGVAPLKDAKKDGIPPDARWTKISRKLVNPAALEAGKERFEAREDFVIVLRVLTREEVQGYAEVTQRIRAAREDEEEAEANKRRRARRDQHERHKREQRNGDVDPRERSDRDRGERSERHRRHRSEHDREAASDSDSDSTDDHVEDKPKMLEAPKSRKSALEEPLMSGGLGEVKQDPLGLTNMGNLRENPDVPGQYTGYVRNPPMPQAATVKKASLMG